MHVDGFGETRKKFTAVVESVNHNPLMWQKVTWKGIQDRFKSLQQDFDKEDKRNQKMYGVGGEAGEMKRLLMEL